MLEAVYGDAPPVRLACHANVLSQRSAVFRAALDSGMSESSTRTITARPVTSVSRRTITARPVVSEPVCQ